MELTCDCCGKTFGCRVATRYELYFCIKPDMRIVNYIKNNFDSPLCTECNSVIRETFSQINVNPRIRYGKR